MKMATASLLIANLWSIKQIILNVQGELRQDIDFFLVYEFPFEH